MSGLNDGEEAAVEEETLENHTEDDFDEDLCLDLRLVKLKCYHLYQYCIRYRIRLVLRSGTGTFSDRLRLWIQIKIP